VLDAAIVWGLSELGLGPYLARALSLTVSVAYTFCLNRLLTFRASGPVRLHEVVAYLGASGIGMAINYGLYAGGVKLGLSWFVAMAIGTIVASIFNFLAYGRIFQRREPL
jgi:putative flippase GtrA